MSIYIPEENEIYFSKTREYFQEVLSSYANKNYRSATVMLYSVAICDILFKLQELRDMYNDSIATSILNEIEKSRNAHDKKSKSLWEKELIDRIYKDTNLLPLEAYTNLNHLYDHRNFSAHPALNDDYELISPSQETTIAHIKNILNDILIKPPIFIKNILNTLVNDLSEKKVVYESEFKKFEIFLNNKYFSKMPQSMKVKVYLTLWKFCFCMPDDSDCKANRKINRMALCVLSKDNDFDILNVLKNENAKLTVSADDNSVKNLVLYLSDCIRIYKFLNEEIVHHLDAVISKNDNAKVLSWFKVDSLNKHLKYMLTLEELDITKATVERLSKYYISNGEKELLMDFYVHLYRVSRSYNEADSRFDQYIFPNLLELTKEQVIDLIIATSGNQQIYGRKRAHYCNTQIISNCKVVLGEDFDYKNTNYYFEFDESVLGLNDEIDDQPDTFFDLFEEETLPF